MIIKLMSIVDLNEASYNPRIKLKPGMPDYEKLKQSIATFGFVDPPIYNTQTKHLVGGHQRVQVALDLGYKEIEVSLVDLPLEKEKLLNVALNKISGQWDETKLAELLIQFEPSEISLTGFDLDEVNDLFIEFNYDEDGNKILVEDEFNVVEEYQAIETPQTNLGELYQLGPHYLLCGDATKIEDVNVLMQGKQADLVVTDPPYNVAVESDSQELKESGRESLLNDNLSDEDFYSFLIATFGSYHHLMKNQAAIYIFHGSSYQREFENAMNANDIVVRSQCIWVKNNVTFGWSQYRWQHEPCFYAYINKQSPSWYGDRKQSTVWRDDLIEDINSTVWEVSRGDVNKFIHPTQKPLSLLAIPIRNSSKRGDLVVDLFAGSGSTLLAAHQLERTCYTMELDPKFCDVILKRFEQDTGIVPKRIN